MLRISFSHSFSACLFASLLVSVMAFLSSAHAQDPLSGYRQLYADGGPLENAAASPNEDSSEIPSEIPAAVPAPVPTGFPPVSETQENRSFPPVSMGVPGFGVSTAPVLNVTAKVSRLPDAQGPGTLEIFTTIPKGFKIYSTTQEAGGPFPTKIHLPEAILTQGNAVPSPAAHAEKDLDVWGEMTIETHKTSVKWTIAFTWKDAQTLPHQLTGSVEAQMCDANSCLPPKKFPFTATVPEAAHAAPSVPESEAPTTGNSESETPFPAEDPVIPLESSIPSAPEVPSAPAVSPESEVSLAPEVSPTPEVSPASEVFTGESEIQLEEGATLPLKPAEKTENSESAETPEDSTAPIAGLEWDGSESAPERSLLILLVMAYLGGLILNLMPCVLPVIAPKLHSFVRQSGEARGRVFLLNVSYTFGLLTVLWLLAALSRIAELLAFLKAILPESAAQALPEMRNLGWGQQFTYPAFVIFMIALVFIMGLSFLGIWEIPIPGMISSGKLGKMQRKEGFLGAYCMGILTTLLATPCVGPYLGPVFGWVITQPVWMSFLVFTVIGLGLGTPYLLIGAFPFLIRFLPKPGEWMETLKEIMGFFFLGTVVWLFYVLPAQFTVPTLGFLVALWFACWLIGKTTLSGASREAVLTAWAAGIIVSALTGFVLFSLDSGSTHAAVPQAKDSAESVSDSQIPWQKFSNELVDKMRTENRVVFIDFTARWCATCQTNSKLAIQTLKVNEFIRSHEIAPVLADWTEPSEEIEQYIHRMGRNSIPLIVIWIPGEERPILIDGLVSESKILSALEFAVNESASKEKTGE